MQGREFQALILRADCKIFEGKTLEQRIKTLENIIRNEVSKEINNANARVDVEELTQAVIQKGIEKIHQLKSPSNIVAWFAKIARNLTKKYIVRMSRILVTSFDTEDPKKEFKELKYNYGSVDLHLMCGFYRQQVLHYINERLKELSDMHRKVVKAFYYDGDSIAQIAKNLSKPAGTIKRLLHDARNKIRWLLLNAPPWIKQLFFPQPN